VKKCLSLYSSLLLRTVYEFSTTYSIATKRADDSVKHVYKDGVTVAVALTVTIAPASVSRGTSFPPSCIAMVAAQQAVNTSLKHNSDANEKQSERSFGFLEFEITTRMTTLTELQKVNSPSQPPMRSPFTKTLGTVF